MSKRSRLRRALRRRLRRDHLRGDYSVPATLTRLEAQVLKETRKEALTILNKAPSFAEWTMKQGGPLEMLRHVPEKMSVSNRKSVEEMASSASSAESLNMLTIDELLKHNVFKEMPWAPQAQIIDISTVDSSRIHMDGPFWLSICSACGEFFRLKNDSDEIDSTSMCGECAEKGL